MPTKTLPPSTPRPSRARRTPRRRPWFARLHVAVLGVAACLSTSCSARLEGVAEDALLTFVAPMDGALADDMLPVSLRAEPADEVIVVELFAGDAVVHEWNHGPFSMELDTDALDSGEVMLRARARFADGREIEATRAVRVDNAGPTIRVRAPADAQIVYLEDGPFEFAIEAEDGGGISRAVLKAAGRIVNETGASAATTELTASIDPSAYARAGEDTPIVLEAEATDLSGRSSKTVLSVSTRSRLRWAFPVVGSVQTSPAILRDGAVVAGTLQGWLHVLERSGTERCKVQAPDEQVLAGPVEVPGREAVVWGTTRRLRMTSTRDCRHVWEYEPMSQWLAEPAIGPDGTVYAATFDAVLHAVDPTGRPKFTANLAAALRAGAAAEARGATTLGPDGAIYQGLVVGARDGGVVSIDATGATRWAVPAPAVRSGVHVGDDALYFGASDGRLYALATSSGARVWSREPGVGAQVGVPCRPGRFRDGDLVVCDQAGYVAAFDPATGTERWSHALDETAVVNGVIEGGMTVSPAGVAYVGDVLGVMHGFASDGARAFHFRTGDEIVARPASDDEMIVFGSADQRVYAVWTASSNGD